MRTGGGRRAERSKKPSTGGRIDRSHGTEHQSLTHPIWITKVRRIGSPWVARRTLSVRPLISSKRTIILRVPLSLPLDLSLSRLSPIRLLQFETEYISRSATSTDARQDKWPRDGGYITFQNWPNRRLSGDEKEGPIYRAAGPYTCIGRRGAVRRGAMHCLSRAAATSSLFKDSSSARFPNRRAIFKRGFSHS